MASFDGSVRSESALTSFMSAAAGQIPPIHHFNDVPNVLISVDEFPDDAVTDMVCALAKMHSTNASEYKIQLRLS